MKPSLLLFAALLRPSLAQDVVCYQSAVMAATQSGVGSADGFRLIEIHRDALEGTTWATVRRCRYPERPARMLLLDRGARVRQEPGSLPLAALRPLVFAGQRVHMSYRDQMLRLEVGGTAEASGSLGARIKVRLANSGEERYAIGVVVSAGELEMEP